MPEALNVAVVVRDVGAENVTVPGPLALLQAYVSRGGLFGTQLSVASPGSVTAVPKAIVWSGPALTHGGPNHVEVVARIEKVARNSAIPLQHEAISSSSGTDTDVIFWTRGGIPSVLISLPNRYMHSPVELVSLKDLEKIPELLAGFAFSLKHGEEFKVKI